MVIGGGKVIAVGGRSIIERYKGEEIVDLKGQVVLPAFIDSHNHLSFAAMLPRWADVHDITRKECLLAAMKHQAEVQDKWIIGFPWRDGDEGGISLTSADLDEVSRDRPVLLIHWTFHKAVANSVALQMAGFDDSSKDPTFGWLLRSMGRNLTGVVLERAMIPLLKMAMDVPESELADLIEQRARSFLKLGITSIQDTGATPSAIAAYRLLHEGGRLPISVLMMPHGQTLLDNNVSHAFIGPRTGEGDEILRVGPVKLFADGGINGTIAYAGRIGGQDYRSGSFREDFEEPLMEASERGFRVCVHSIGNVTTSAVLDAFEQAKDIIPENFEMRPRIEHMFLLSNDQISRLHWLGGCASVQPFCIQNAPRYLKAPFEGHHWLPYRSLENGGIEFSASSDDPGMGSMMYMDPLQCASMGANMAMPSSPYHFPEQALPFMDWIRRYTSSAAYVGGLERERGMLKPGMVADLVILEGELNPTDIPRVKETWRSGDRVFIRNSDHSG